jgi:hypothetical protein
MLMFVAAPALVHFQLQNPKVKNLLAEKRVLAPRLLQYSGYARLSDGANRIQFHVLFPDMLSNSQSLAGMYLHSHPPPGGVKALRKSACSLARRPVIFTSPGRASKKSLAVETAPFGLRPVSRAFAG